MTKPSSQLKIDLMMLLVALMWAPSYGTTKHALASVSVLLFIALRFGLSTLILLPWLLTQFKQARASQWWLGILSGGLLSAIFYFEVSGVQHTTAANAAVLISLCVIMTPVIEKLALAKQIAPMFYVAVPLSIMGAGLLVSEQGFNLNFNRGDGYILLAAVLRASLSVFAKRLLQDSTLNSLFLTGIQFMTVTALAAIAAWVFADSQFISLSGQLIGQLTFLILACTLLAFALINYGLKRASASRVVLITGSEPLFAVLLSVFLFNEQLSSLQFIGVACIVLATYLVIGKTSANTKPSRSITSPT